MTKLKTKNILYAFFATISVIVATLIIAYVVTRPSHTISNKVRVVASTNVWGSIAAQIGGKNVEVTSILSDPEADPHLFESDAKTASEVGSAQLVIVNGLGYDEFMDKLISASPSTSRETLNVSQVLNVADDANPHLWYDIPRINEVATAMRDDLIKIDPAHKSAYEQNTSTFIESLKPLIQQIEAIKQQHGGAGVTYTERVAGYLIEDSGLVNQTPEDFASAVEEGNDPSPAQLSSFERVLASGSVSVLLYNNQAVNDMTVQIQDAAKKYNVAIVGVSETVPAGKTFQAWQLDQINAIIKAL